MAISVAMRRMMTVSASTKRATHSLSTGKRATPATYLTGVACMPLDQVGTQETRARMQSMGIDTPLKLFQTVVSGAHDIIKGDTLTVDAVDYAIRDAEPWAADTTPAGQGYIRLILEMVKP